MRLGARNWLRSATLAIKSCGPGAILGGNLAVRKPCGGIRGLLGKSRFLSRAARIIFPFG